jgi:putative RNA 2'-phosphotransferase
MMDNSLIHISKFLSLILRHNPGKIGLTLDANGWADVDELLQKANRTGFRFDRQMLEKVVAENDKKRFAFSPDGTKIRASQGHSIQVDLQLEPATPPAVLYHGTAERFKDSILEKGLLPGNRQHVHFSKDVETAIKVGSRHGKPIVLIVDTRMMKKDGLVFYLSDNGVWLTEKVPVKYLSLVAEKQETRIRNKT